MDPYVKIIKTMQGEGAKNNPPSICIGTVISPPPNLIVQTQDMQIYKDDIYIADYLLSGYERDVTTVSTSTITKITSTDTLKAGDLLSIMPTIDNQTWIILCKVVKI